MREIVILHTSDLHLDARHALANDSDGCALAMTLDVARRVGADIVLLAGDTFDNHRQPAQFVARVAQTIATAAVPVVILPGNHDPLVEEAVYHRMGASAPGNLHVLGVTHEEAVVFPSFDLEVWGRPHRDYGDMIPFEAVRPRRTRWQIAMAHGHYHPVPDRSTPLRPSWLIGDAELAATSSDYVALGHWNRAAQVGCGAVPAYYSGSPDYAGTVNVVRFGVEGEVRVEREALSTA
jgi:DNA repair exonuclease SbcCD nuclease subunit